MNFDESHLRILHVNIRGIRSNKRNLEHYLEENKYPDIVTLNETKLGKGIKFEIDGYYCASRREPTVKGGKHGSMILVKDSVVDVVELDFLETLSQHEVIGIEIKKKERQPGINIITYYNPPGNKIDPKILRKSTYPKHGTIILGDLNCKNHSWGSNSTDPQGIHLKDTLDDENWLILNDGSKTRCDPISGKEEVLDIVVCTPEILTMNPEFYVGDDIGSDHYPLHTNLAFHSQQTNPPIYIRTISQTD